MKTIPIHQLHKKKELGLEIRKFKIGDFPLETEFVGAHRDDHYLFFLFEKGTASLMIDFQELSFSEGTIYYILPGQVHHRIYNNKAQGWFLAVDTSLVPAESRYVFENNLPLQQPLLLGDDVRSQCKTILAILEERGLKNQSSSFQLKATQLLLQSVINIMAGCYNHQNQSVTIHSRPTQIVQQFKKLLADNLYEIKSPSTYAVKLNVTENYLNEILKKATGFPVSYWIIKEIMLEAKRLLYYTTLNVKEIANKLGYKDHAYFSRIFKKSEGTSPLRFRSKYSK
jgi:AraC family transcriptional regulator, transcriptional activator of pobA